jgi:hypothetical protein
MGPATHAGCGALCPAFARGCYGCFGPKGTPNTAALADRLAFLGLPDDEVGRLFRTFNTGAEAFRAEGERHEVRS